MMKKFLVVVIAMGALYYYKPGLFPSFGHNGAFDAKGNPQVLVFTDVNCQDWCAKAMQDLAERGVAFQELKLADGEQVRERYQSLGGDGVIPYVVAGERKVRGYDRGMNASALGATFGDRYLTRAERMYFPNHFKADGSPAVYVYGATWCGYCKIMRDELDKHHIEYVEVDVDMRSDRGVMEDAMQLGGLPTTYVGYERIVGERIDAVLTAAKTAGKRRQG